MFRFAWSLAIVAGFTTTALADLPPPPPEAGFKRVPYEHVVKLAKEIPGYRFYSFRAAIFGDGTIEKELKLGTENGVVVPGSSSPSVRMGVLAVPEKVVGDLKTNENLATLVSRENQDKLPAGVVIYETSGTSRDLKVSDPRTKVQNVIVVSPDAKAGVKFTPHEAPGAPGKNASSDASSGAPVSTLAAGIAGALAMISLGLWYFRGRST